MNNAEKGGLWWTWGAIKTCSLEPEACILLDFCPCYVSDNWQKRYTCSELLHLVSLIPQERMSFSSNTYQNISNNYFSLHHTLNAFYKSGLSPRRNFSCTWACVLVSQPMSAPLCLHILEVAALFCAPWWCESATGSALKAVTANALQVSGKGSM